MQRLEEHKGFSVIAWTLIFVFAFFTYHLTTRVTALEEEYATTKTEAAITDLDAYFE